MWPPQRGGRFLAGNVVTGILCRRNIAENAHFFSTFGPGSMFLRLPARYSLIERLGKGGMGEVVRVEDRETRETVALKCVEVASPEELRRVEHEARTLGQLRHPGIVRLHDVGRTEGGSFYFTMDYVRGVPLSALVDRPLPRDAALDPRSTSRSLSRLFGNLGDPTGRGFRGRGTVGRGSRRRVVRRRTGSGDRRAAHRRGSR